LNTEYVKRGKAALYSSGMFHYYILFLSKYVVGRNFEETDEAGEITRLDGYHEGYYFFLIFFDSS